LLLGKTATGRYRLQPAPAPLAWVSAANIDLAQSLRERSDWAVVIASLQAGARSAA
jgi:hypothetical protein